MYETRQHKEATSRVIQKPEGKRGQRVCFQQNKKATIQHVQNNTVQRAALILVSAKELVVGKDPLRFNHLYEATKRFGSKSPICVKLIKSDYLKCIEGKIEDAIGVNDNIDVFGHSIPNKDKVHLPGGFGHKALKKLLIETYNIPVDWEGSIRIFSCHIGERKGRYMINLMKIMRENFDHLKSVQANDGLVNVTDYEHFQGRGWKTTEGGGVKKLTSPTLGDRLDSITFNHPPSGEDLIGYAAQIALPKLIGKLTNLHNNQKGRLWLNLTNSAIYSEISAFLQRHTNATNATKDICIQANTYYKKLKEAIKNEKETKERIERLKRLKDRRVNHSSHPPLDPRGSRPRPPFQSNTSASGTTRFPEVTPALRLTSTPVRTATPALSPDRFPEVTPALRRNQGR